MTQSAMKSLFDATGALIRATPDLRAFATWPDTAPEIATPPQGMPGLSLITGLSAPTDAQTSTVVDAIKAAAPVAHWQQTYTEAEVGRDFLNRYGWFELLGPTGHLFSDTTRAYVAFWGEGLHYAMHLHEAEELYYILAGSAEFHADGMPSVMVTPGGTRHHRQNQPHAMDTHAEPVLALVLWRGPGLTGIPRMGTT